MSQESASGYNRVQILLHWLIAALVVFQLLFAGSITTTIDAAEEGSTPSATDQALGASHYWIGIAILVLVLARLVVRLRAGAPAPAASAPNIMQIAAKISHFAFYVLLIATPILGLLAFYFGDPYGPIHMLNRPAFIILIAIHAAAALFHQFWLKDGTLTKMVRPAQ
ncbi:MAG: cytochrome b562 [Devosia sp.]|uniref:cytochrome b/b6 domain-containing protein n=1 Tax=Devosia sp. TaxID=1871048 RepID=UPI00261018D9|nr:cytochrome b/b6 domain-containing protein [Devosia sp.]MDB5587758.1 cytochrome b562 [Devosia sp.]